MAIRCFLQEKQWDNYLMIYRKYYYKWIIKYKDYQHPKYRYDNEYLEFLFHMKCDIHIYRNIFHKNDKIYECGRYTAYTFDKLYILDRLIYQKRFNINIDNLLYAIGFTTQKFSYRGSIEIKYYTGEIFPYASNRMKFCLFENQYLSNMINDHINSIKNPTKYDKLLINYINMIREYIMDDN